MLKFGTLGPEGSNHEWVTQKYLSFHELGRVRIELFSSFSPAFENLLAGHLDYIVQAAVHDSVTDMVARHRNRAHLIDTFISPSQPMAVISRSDVRHPRSLGLQSATREYIDTSAWEELVFERSTINVGQGLLAGRYDSGLTLLSFAEEHPDRLEVVKFIGVVVDPWLVFGRHPVVEHIPLIWPDSPAARLFRGRQTVSNATRER